MTEILTAEYLASFKKYRESFRNETWTLSGIGISKY